MSPDLTLREHLLETSWDKDVKQQFARRAPPLSTLGRNDWGVPIPGKTGGQCLRALPYRVPLRGTFLHTDEHQQQVLQEVERRARHEVQAVAAPLVHK